MFKIFGIEFGSDKLFKYHKDSLVGFNIIKTDKTCTFEARQTVEGFLIKIINCSIIPKEEYFRLLALDKQNDVKEIAEVEE